MVEITRDVSHSVGAEDVLTCDALEHLLSEGAGVGPRRRCWPGIQVDAGQLDVVNPESGVL